MSTSAVRRTTGRAATHRRAAALSTVWWIAALVMTPPFLMLMVASDFLEDRYPGAVIGVLVLSAAFAAARVRTWPVDRARRLSLLVSGVWLAGAALVYPTQEFAVDVAYAAGVPVVVALLTVVLGLRVRRADVRR